MKNARLFLTTSVLVSVSTLTASLNGSLAPTRQSQSRSLGLEIHS